MWLPWPVFCRWSGWCKIFFNHTHKVRGLSLLEVLIAIGLIGVLLSVIAQVLLPGFQIWKKTRARAEVEQAALLAEARIKRAFLPSTPDSVTIVNLPTLSAMSFLTHDGSDSVPSFDPVSGRTFWRAFTILKLDPAKKQLVRLRWEQPPLPTTDPFAFSQAELTTACSSGLKEERWASHLESFEVTPDSGETRWNFALTFTTNSPSGQLVARREFLLTPRIQGENE